MTISYAQNVGLVKTPPQVNILNRLYRTIVLDGKVWTAEDFVGDIQGVSKYVMGGKHYYKYNESYKTNFENILPTGWRLPTKTDIRNLIQNVNLPSLCSTSEWNGIGTNATTMNLGMDGIVSDYGGTPHFEDNYKNYHVFYNVPGWNDYIRIKISGTGAGTTLEIGDFSMGNSCYTVRFVRDL